MTKGRTAMVVVVDRLGAGFLGPYGNTWLDTPACNRLAAESLLLEFAFSEAPDLATLYRSYWQGVHALCDPPPLARTALAARLSDAGIPSVLMTDEAAVAGHALSEVFADRIALPPVAADRLADDIEQTQLARLFSSAIERLKASPPAGLCWIHARGMSGPWDAPLEFRQRFVEEGDPPPLEFTAPPERKLAPGFDPDELLGIVHAYSGQVTVMDLCLAALLEALNDYAGKDELLLVFTTPRGFPLGEHLRVGACDNALYGELLHVPWLLRCGDGAGAMRRVPGLVQTSDLYATLLDWFGLPPGDVWGQSLLPFARGESAPLRNVAAAATRHERSLRTPAWSLRQTEAGSELYVRPDDRWEVNDVTNLCQEVVAQMTQALDQFQRAAQANCPSELPALPESLLVGVD